VKPTPPGTPVLTPATASPAQISAPALPEKPKPGHVFEIVKFATPTYCPECKYFIWGLSRSGHHCKNCGINVHKKCLGTMVPCEAQKE